MDWIGNIINSISGLIAIGAYHYEVIAIAAAVGFPLSIWAVFRYRHTPPAVRLAVLAMLFILVAGLIALEVWRDGF